MSAGLSGAGPGDAELERRRTDFIRAVQGLPPVPDRNAADQQPFLDWAAAMDSVMPMSHEEARAARLAFHAAWTHRASYRGGDWQPIIALAVILAFIAGMTLLLVSS